MSNSKIAEVVQQAAGSIPSGYQSKVTDVVTALEDHASGIADRLESAAIEMGADRDAVKNLLVEVGLRTPEPEPQAPEAGSGDGVAELLRRVERLEQAAARAGVRL